MTRARLALVLLFGVAVLPGARSQAYLKFGSEVDGRLVTLRWDDLPIQYFINERAAGGVSPTELQQAVGRAFQSWSDAPMVTLSAQFVGFTTTEPVNNDFVSVIGFQSQPDEPNTLGSASYLINDDGTIAAADIFLNGIFPWSVAPNGESGRFDVESIALHEIGHLLGLGHSVLGETELFSNGDRRVIGKRAVMFPIAYPRGNIEDRTLEADDRAGILDVYGTNEASRETGAVSGRVTLNGRGIFGAHVEAFNPSTGEIVGGFSLSDAGHFVIAGLAPGLYVIRAEPLDDADIDSFFEDDGTVNVDFRATYFSRLVAVPPGGTSGDIEIKVRAK